MIHIRLLADYNHDGVLDSEKPSSHAFAVVLPVSALPSTNPFRRWTLMGDIDPLDVGAVILTLDGPLPDDAQIVLQTDGSCSGRIHLFRRDGADWHALGSSEPWRLEAADVDSNGRIVLGLVIHEFDPAWIGAGRAYCRSFALAAKVLSADGTLLAGDSANFRVAPFQLASSLDPVEQVLVVRNELTQTVVDALETMVRKAGATLHTIDIGGPGQTDMWMQDTVEIGRYVVPGPDGVARQAVGLLPGLRAHNEIIDCKPLDAAVRSHFAQAGAIIADVARPREGTRWIDWFGNLEVSPPVRSADGQDFAHGRILVGSQHELDMHPDVMAFLNAQALQTPALVVDTSWLTIGHVDEVVNFVPAEDLPGFRVLLPSPRLATRILEKLVSQGHSSLPLFAGTDEETTVGRLLENVARSDESEAIERALARTRALLCQGLGIDDGHFIEIPALFRDGVAVFPNCVNCLVVNRTVIVPDPRGPLVDGEDVFAASIRESLTQLGLIVHFIDIWEPYHVRRGEIHCGTNAVRWVGTRPWWEIGWVCSK